MDKPNGVVVIRIVFLRRKDQEWEKIWVGPKRLQALNNVPSVEFEGLSSNYDLMALKSRTGR
jgi:hypothetical protein